ncbi:nascent polypeptide-associated complex subunit alpha [Forsythia ovata]|uniref:Nascent polypeptide-associated complex subunit alpha n=1 Tax=Forsythia ovata TaxID=205694 RepID=A0ABD1T341_9LAMI
MGIPEKPGQWLLIIYAMAFCLAATSIAAYKPYTYASPPPPHYYKHRPYVYKSPPPPKHLEHPSYYYKSPPPPKYVKHPAYYYKSPPPPKHSEHPPQDEATIV